MQRWTKNSAFAARVLVVFGTLNLACSSPPQDGMSWGRESQPPPPGKEQPPLDPFAPGASVVCGTEPLGSDDAELEVYQVSAMNHKLRYYPEFASEIGIESVSDCESARNFIARYAEYSDNHPSFDADEPLPPIAEGDPEPDEPSGSLDEEGEKVIVGNTATNHPVVKISFTTCRTVSKTGQVTDTCPLGQAAREPDGSMSWRHVLNTPTGNRQRGSCTGTFIAKNWILTAAHCVNRAAVDFCVKLGQTRAACQPRFDHWGYWTINGTKRGPGGGAIPYTITNVRARGYAAPNWIGRTNWMMNPLFCPQNNSPCYPRDTGAEHDIALLYIGSVDGDKLPPEIERMGEMDEAMRLSVVQPRLPPGPMSWPMRFYGWGGFQGIDPQGDTAPLLRVGDNPPPLALSFAPGPLNIIGTHPADSLDHPRSHVCPGDSGGPLVRANVVTPSNTGARTVEAIVGVLSAGHTDCVFPMANQTITWARVDQNHGFITDMLRREQPLFTFRCQGRLGTPAAPELLECWGPPCSTIAECNPQGGPATRTCWQPGGPRRSQANCYACNGLGEGCGCIRGQCLPTPVAPPR